MNASNSFASLPVMPIAPALPMSGEAIELWKAGVAFNERSLPAQLPPAERDHPAKDSEPAR